MFFGRDLKLQKKFKPSPTKLVMHVVGKKSIIHSQFIMKHNNSSTIMCNDSFRNNKFLMFKLKKFKSNVEAFHKNY